MKSKKYESKYIKDLRKKFGSVSVEAFGEIYDAGFVEGYEQCQDETDDIVRFAYMQGGISARNDLLNSIREGCYIEGLQMAARNKGVQHANIRLKRK